MIVAPTNATRIMVYNVLGASYNLPHLIKSVTKGDIYTIVMLILFTFIYAFFPLLDQHLVHC